ncbi:hypothetical protein AYM40_25275 [Paraburkholderia phytofirmans OLGA172]|uniref:Uncharacterized protein n=1 Tax=Paraburkholderia phytofirmans OLGA172 TaxID=1417228 RepID=A0A160FS67_9BURK|nr:hypothetical protein [Paraburkholderia phytofirmans]ANB75654.1 hypothetical protein AYM40_25275 [Paraburkholderia phytofirmans OLGA172]
MKTNEICIDGTTKKTIQNFSVVFVVILYYSIVVKFCPNAPYFDDFFSILEPLTRIAENPSRSNIIASLVSQNNQHRVITTHIAAIFSWLVAGKVSFWALNLFGNTLLLVAAFAIVRSLQPADQSMEKSNEVGTYKLVVAFLLFNLSFFRLLSFPMAAVSNFGVYAFAILGYWALFSGRTVVGFLSLVASVASQANGLIALPLAAIYLALNRDWRRAAWASGLSVVTIGLYFFHYDFHATMSPLIIANSQTDGGSSVSLPTRLLYLFVQIGSLGMLNNRAVTLPKELVIIPALTGVALIILHFRLLWVGALKERRALSAFLWFLLAAFAAISIVRINSNIDDWVAVRYKLISCLYAASLLGLVAKTTEKKIFAKYSWSGVLISITFIYWTTSFAYLLPHISHFRKFTAPLTTERWDSKQEADAAALVLSKAESLNIYKWK